MSDSVRGARQGRVEPSKGHEAGPPPSRITALEGGRYRIDWNLVENAASLFGRAYAKELTQLPSAQRRAALGYFEDLFEGLKAAVFEIPSLEHLVGEATRGHAGKVTEKPGRHSKKIRDYNRTKAKEGRTVLATGGALAPPKTEGDGHHRQRKDLPKRTVVDFDPDVIEVRRPRPLGESVEAAARRLKEKPQLMPTSSNLIQELTTASLETADVVAAFVAAKDNDAVAEALEAPLRRSGIDHPARLAHTLTTALAGRIGLELAVRPVAERLEEAVAAARQRLEHWRDDPMARREQARALLGTPVEAARARLQMMGLADSELEEALAASPSVAAWETLIQKAARRGLERLSALDGKHLAGMLGRVEIFKLAPELTRAALACREVGLDPHDYPFEGVTPKNAAQAAVIEAIDDWDRSGEEIFRMALIVATAALTMGASAAGIALRLGTAVASDVPTLATEFAAVAEKQAMLDTGYGARSEIQLETGIAAATFVFGLALEALPATHHLAKHAMQNVAPGALEVFTVLLHATGIQATKYGASHLAKYLGEHFGEEVSAERRAEVSQEAASARRSMTFETAALRTAFTRALAGREVAPGSFERAFEAFALFERAGVASMRQAGSLAGNFERFVRGLLQASGA